MYQSVVTVQTNFEGMNDCEYILKDVTHRLAVAAMEIIVQCIHISEKVT